MLVKFRAVKLYTEKKRSKVFKTTKKNFNIFEHSPFIENKLQIRLPDLKKGTF